MSRSGYVEGMEDQWAMICWRGAVTSAIRGKRGQSLLKEMLTALDAMPVKRLIATELVEPDLIPCSHWGLFETESVCALGTVGKARGIDMSQIDPENREGVAKIFNIATPLEQEIVWINDEAGPWHETPEGRFVRVRAWVESQIKKDQAV